MNNNRIHSINNVKMKINNNKGDKHHIDNKFII